MSLFLDLIFPSVDLSTLNSTPSQSIKHLPQSRFDGVLSVFKYHGCVKDIIADFKFDFVSELAPRLASVMSVRLRRDFPQVLSYWQENNFILVPIPLHYFRQNWRGFNQSELLCQSLAPLLKLNHQNLLFRSKNTSPQSLIKDKKLRLSNLHHSFTTPLVKEGAGGRLNLILVDDVYTTGSTLNSAAAAFPPGTNLWGLTLAS